MQRYTVGASSNMRKTRDGKPSMLPKPRRPGSTDRASSEAYRPSNIRSSSADQPRTNIGVMRKSKDASATKIPINRRSKSQQYEGDRRGYGQGAMTPLRSSNFRRPTTATTPRTPSEDRYTRSWQASLDRAIACLVCKDNRPLQNQVWLRTTMARVQEALNARGDGSVNLTLSRPLSIQRFVDIVGVLLSMTITKDCKLNTDNYITRLPHMSKRLLYPGNVSKSWLRTVNTPHTFPNALGLIVYLVDLVARVEMPLDLDMLYLDKDELAHLRRQYVSQCWIRFQEPDQLFDDIDEQYLQTLKMMLGDDEEKIAKLQLIVNDLQLRLEDEAEAAARADEARRVEARSGLLGALRGERGARVATRGRVDEGRARVRGLTDQLRTLETEIERASSMVQQLKLEVEQQPLSITERTKVLEEIDYANRVNDSKRILVQQISKMVLSKETELALWQKKTLDSCVEYKQGLFHLSSAYPDLAQAAVDEKDLMGSGCAREVAAALEELREKHAAILQRANTRERDRQADKRKRVQRMSELRLSLAEVRADIERSSAALEADRVQEAAEVGAGAGARGAGGEAEGRLRGGEADLLAAEQELLYWERQNDRWLNKLCSFRENIVRQRAEAPRRLDEAKERRANLVLEAVASWQKKMAEITKRQ